MSVVGGAEPAVANVGRPARRRYWVRRVLAGLYGATFGVLTMTSPEKGLAWPEDWVEALEWTAMLIAVLAVIAYAFGFRPRRGAWFWRVFPWGVLAMLVYSLHRFTLAEPVSHDDVALALFVLTTSIALYPFIHLLFRFRNVGRLPEVEGAQAPRGVKRWLGLRAERDVWSGAVSHPRWFQFGIAGPALLVTLWCVWLGLKVEQLRGQREAVVRLEASHAALKMHQLSDLEDAVKTYLPKELLADVQGVILSEDGGGDELIPDLLKCRSVEGIALPFERCEFTDRGVRPLGELRKLKKLGMGKTEVTDDSLVALSRNKMLEELIVDSNRVTDIGIHAIANCPLGFLDVKSTKITDEGIVALGECDSLYSLTISEAAMTDRGLAAIAKLPQLYSLALLDVEIDGSGFAAIGKQPQLERLIIFNTKLSDEGVALLAKIASVEALTISNSPLTDGAAEGLKRYYKGNAITLRNVGLTDNSLIALCSIPSLRTLTMARTNVTGEAVWQLSHFPQILWLDLSGSPITDSGFAAIVNKLSAPCDLDVNGTQITVAAFRLCRPTSHLIHLSCAQTWITDDAIFECRKFEGLESLHLEWTLVTPRAISAFQSMRCLEGVFAEGTAIDTLSDEELDDLLPNVFVRTSGDYRQPW
jgi:uncharacterized membrane protein HdeD (DUF308 family)